MSKPGILKRKQGPSSKVLAEEAKRMEEKLSALREFMKNEKDKRVQVTKQRDGGK